MKEEQKYNGSKTRNYFTAYLLASIRGKRLRYLEKQQKILFAEENLEDKEYTDADISPEERLELEQKEQLLMEKCLICCVILGTALACAMPELEISRSFRMVRYIHVDFLQASFVVMRLDMQNTIEEERVHFGKWDIEFKKKRMIYDGTEIIITDLQWDILELLMSDSELSFSIKEIAYATNIEVYEAQIYVEELLKTIKEQTGSAIVQKNEERYSFVEITD